MTKRNGIVFQNPQFNLVVPEVSLAGPALEVLTNIDGAWLVRLAFVFVFVVLMAELVFCAEVVFRTELAFVIELVFCDPSLGGSTDWLALFTILG